MINTYFKKGSVLLSILLISSCSSNITLSSIDSDNIQASNLNKNFIPIFTSEKDWGKNSQIAATYEELNDIKGNIDGIWDNEKDKPGTVNGFGISAPLRPIFQKTSKLLEGQFSTTNIVKAIADFRKTQEQKWGKSVSNLDLSEIKNGQLFAAQKAIYLTRFKRTPDQVTDFFVKASGSVNGYQIKDREIFCQRFKSSSPNGKLVVISPGFLESGRNFYEQADLFNKKGFDVVIMDHQWAGYTKGGEPGLVDRGFGVTRDTAAVVGYATKFSKNIILVGNSMGSGPGALGAVTMNDNNKIFLDGPSMPKGIDVILQSAFLGSTKNIINKGLSLFAQVPLAKNIQLYNVGLPILTTNKVAAQKAMQISLLEDSRAQAETMVASNEDIEVIMNMIKNGKYPIGQVNLIHADKDPLADVEKVKVLNSINNSKFNLKVINSNNHVFEQNPDEQSLAIESLLKL